MAKIVSKFGNVAVMCAIMMRSLTIVLLTVLLTGCALLGSGETEIAAVSDEEAQEAPIAVQIVSAHQEQGKLRVTARVEAKTDISVAGVAIGVVGLTDGVTTREVFKKLSDVTGAATLSRGDSLVVPFELASEDLGEFQLRVLWGAEARPVLARLEPEASSLSRARLASSTSETLKESALFGDEEHDPIAKILNSGEPQLNRTVRAGEAMLTITETKEKSVSNCSHEPCDILYTLVASLENTGDTPIDGVTLAVGIFWANAGALPVVPEAGAAVQDSEEEIVLQKLALQPGERKRLVIDVDQPVPPVRGGGFVPHVRIVKTQGLR